MGRRPSITDPAILRQLGSDWLQMTVMELAFKYHSSKATLYAVARKHGFPPKMVRGKQVRARPRLNYVSGKENPVPVLFRVPILTHWYEGGMQP